MTIKKKIATNTPQRQASSKSSVSITKTIAQKQLIRSHKAASTTDRSDALKREAAIRNDWLLKLRQCFGNKPKLGDSLESSCYEFAIDYCNSQNLGLCNIMVVYQDRVNDIEFNCRDANFVKRILSPDFKTKSGKRIRITDVPYLQLHEIDPDKWSELIRRKELREDKMKNAQTTDMFTCRKCKQRRSKVWWMQTRSADEPMTMFVQCLCCMNVHKS